MLYQYLPAQPGLRQQRTIPADPTKGFSSSSWLKKACSSFAVFFKEKAEQKLPAMARNLLFRFRTVDESQYRNALPMGNFWMGCGVVLAPIAAIGLFFNLYFIHTYYLNACAPFFALCAGVGLWLVFKLMRTDFI